MLKPVPVFLPSKAIALASNPAFGWSARIFASGLSNLAKQRGLVWSCWGESVCMAA